jgi:hypothetical protein
MMSKVFILLAVIAIGSFASVLKFKTAGSADCTISNVGGTLQTGCGSDSPAPFVTPSEVTLINERLNFMVYGGQH